MIPFDIRTSFPFDFLLTGFKAYRACQLGRCNFHGASMRKDPINHSPEMVGDCRGFESLGFQQNSGKEHL